MSRFVIRIGGAQIGWNDAKGITPFYRNSSHSYIGCSSSMQESAYLHVIVASWCHNCKAVHNQHTTDTESSCDPHQIKSKPTASLMKQVGSVFNQCRSQIILEPAILCIRFLTTKSSCYARLLCRNTWNHQLHQIEVRLFSFEAVVLSSEETGLYPSLTRLHDIFLPSLALFSPNHTLSLCECQSGVWPFSVFNLVIARCIQCFEHQGIACTHFLNPLPNCCEIPALIFII